MIIQMRVVGYTALTHSKYRDIFRGPMHWKGCTAASCAPLSWSNHKRDESSRKAASCLCFDVIYWFGLKFHYQHCLSYNVCFQRILWTVYNDAVSFLQELNQWQRVKFWLVTELTSSTWSERKKYPCSCFCFWVMAIYSIWWRVTIGE